ncbi:twinfilin-2-B-like protein [Sarcoptes scabiei]|uniref:Twinfilin-2-B-like protein n=1 Tax=Sarcoptes scabiei TaxID=52283 RepID=A0A131ZZR2_SARSC|nr:twinfilin-2-B-like protein [Sarcoptes scabiei]
MGEKSSKNPLYSIEVLNFDLNLITQHCKIESLETMANLNLFNPSEEVSNLLKKAKESENPYRLFWLVVDHKQCTIDLGESVLKKGTWQQDYKEFIERLPKSNQPFYLLLHIKSDTVNWSLIHFCPSNADVRAKLSTASVKMTLKNIMGPIMINNDFFVDDYDDLCLEKVIDRILRNKQTNLFRSKQEIEESYHQDMEVMTKIEHSNLAKTGGAFHYNCLLDDKGQAALIDFKSKKVISLRFAMSPDITKIIIDGKITSNDSTPLLSCFEFGKNNQQQLLPEHFQPGYILLSFKHLNPTVQDEILEKIVLLKEKLDADVVHIEVDDLKEVTVERKTIRNNSVMERKLDRNRSESREEEFKAVIESYCMRPQIEQQDAMGMGIGII